MSRYTVDPGELRRVEALLAGTAAHAEAELTGLHHQMRALLEHGWRSPASATFALGWQDWLAGVRELLAALDDMSRAIATSAEGYQRTEDAVRATLVPQ